MKIRHKLILSFLLVATLASVTTVFTLQSYKVIDGSFTRLNDDSSQMIKVLNQLKHAGFQIVSSTSEISFIHSESIRLGEKLPDVDEEMKQLVDEGYAAFYKSFKEYEELTRGIEHDHAVSLANIRNSGTELIKTSDAIVSIRMSRMKDGELSELREKLENSEIIYLGHVNTELASESAEQHAAIDDVHTTIEVATQRTAIVTALTFLLALFLGIYLSFLFARRLGRLTDASRRVGNGELDITLDLHAKDEVGDLSRSFTKMIGDLKASRSNLASAEIFTEKVMESMVDFVVVTDLDLNITKINKATSELNGYDERELIGKSVNFLMADRPFSKKGIDILRKNGTVVSLDKVNLNKDGTLTPISMSLSVLKDEHGSDEAIVCVGRDVSKLRRDELERQAISEIEQGAITTSSLDELFQIAYRALNQCISAENCYIALQDSATGLMRYEFWQDITRPVPDPHPTQKNFGSYVLETRQPLLLTEELKRRVCEMGLVDPSRPYSPSWMGVPLGVGNKTIGILVVQDYKNPDAYTERDLGILGTIGNRLAPAIERNLADRALRAKEQHFRSIIENSSDAIALFGADGSIEYASPSTPQVLGYRPDEMAGLSLYELVHADDKEIMSQRLARLVRQPNTSLDILSRLRHQDGSFRWMEGTFTNLLDKPSVRAIVNNYRDVTERVRAEAERETISDIINGVTSTASLDELLQLIHRSIGKVLYAENCFVALFDPNTEMLDMQFWVDKYDTLPPPFNMGKGFTAFVCRTKKAILLTHDVIEKMLKEGEIELQGTAPAIWLGVPLTTSAGIIGVMAVQHYEDQNAYSLRDLELLVSVGSQIALAIERKRAEDDGARLNTEVEIQRQRFDTMISNVQGVVWETKTKLEKGETSLRFDFVSDFIEPLLGYSVEECLARPGFWLDIIHPEDRAKTEQQVKAIFLSGKGGTIEFRWIAKDGQEVWIETRNTIVKNDAGRSVGLRGIAVDITDRKSLENQLTHQALHDPLTKLGNRLLFRDRVEHAVNRTARKHSPIAVLFLDLDNFKSVNDSLGHAAGDDLLVSVTERLQTCLRASDTPARFGGDEFAILLEDLQHPEQAAVIAERIRLVTAAPFTVAGTEVFISSSIGIALNTDGQETPEELLRNADVAMYISKNNGRNCYTIFEPQMHDVLIKRVRLESDMRSALENSEFEIHYQPIMDLHNGNVMGMEALVRWNHPEQGLLPPMEFIPLAEETGLIVPLGEWILNEACIQARTWQNEYQYGANLSITVNVASRQFEDPRLFEMVENALASSGLPPESLIMEITESTMLENTDATIEKLLDLKKLGIRFAIDDFGTGYSSLSYLRRFPVDILKIDKSFIDKIAIDEEGAAVVNAIISMGGALNLRTVAEGIESLGQKSVLQDLGCELGQGYHFAKPLRTADMNEFLSSSCFKNTGRKSLALPRIIPSGGKSVVVA